MPAAAPATAAPEPPSYATKKTISGDAWIGSLQWPVNAHRTHPTARRRQQPGQFLSTARTPLPSLQPLLPRLASFAHVSHTATQR